VPPPAGKGRFRELLRGGSARAQVISWRMEVKEKPDSADAHVGLGKALAELGECEEALDHLWPYMGTAPFGREAALSASSCSARLGLLQDAILFDRFALDLAPDDIRAQTMLVMHLDMKGDTVGVEEVLFDLETSGSKGGDPSIYARALLALRHGDVDEFDVCVAMWERAGWENKQLWRLDMQLWLDLDDPQRALEGIGPVQRRRGGGRHYIAEAHRRLGETSAALGLLENNSLRVSEGATVDAILARIYVDMGEEAKALELLDNYPEDSDADIVASRWYLALKRGETDHVAAYAKLWSRLNVNRLRRLDLLLPLNQRG
jgi:tetratricopeptide (TPR) repeat protein